MCILGIEKNIFMDSKLEELLNNYNYLLEAVKNNQITPDDAVKTLDSLSVIDNSGRIWKINLYGEFWGQHLLTDFQDRLINVIKNRCEK